MSELELTRTETISRQRAIYERIAGAAAIAFTSIEDRTVELLNEEIDATTGYDTKAWWSVHDYGVSQGLPPGGLKLAAHYAHEISDSLKQSQ
jgi:hypothetical protein